MNKIDGKSSIAELMKRVSTAGIEGLDVFEEDGRYISQFEGMYDTESVGMYDAQKSMMKQINVCISIFVEKAGDVADEIIEKLEIIDDDHCIIIYSDANGGLIVDPDAHQYEAAKMIEEISNDWELENLSWDTIKKSEVKAKKAKNKPIPQTNALLGTWQRLGR